MLVFKERKKKKRKKERKKERKEISSYLTEGSTTSLFGRNILTF
jgi:hypothetical protein